MKKIKNKLTKSLSAILALAILISGIIIPNKIVLATPSSISVTNHGGGNYKGSDYFTSSDGYYIFCGEASEIPPVNPGNTKTLTGWREENNEKVRKVAYYGYASPEKWSKLETFNLWGTPANKGSKGYHLTHYALSNVWGTSPKYFMRNAEMQEFLSYINSKQNAPSWFKVYSTKSGGTQRMFAWNFNQPTPPKKQNLSLLKTSANKTLTDLASKGYSLANAEYKVYSSRSDAQNNKSSIGTLITTVNGSSNKLELDKGIYFIKETKAPKGFFLDEQIHRADLSNADYELKVTDKPKFDPLNLLLTKVSNTDVKLPDAEFEVKFYDGELNESQVKQASSKKTWKFKTNNQGQIAFADSFKVSGDDLFTFEGNPVGLVGTYTFKEVKAPKGYILDDTLYIAHVKDDGKVDKVNGNGTVYNAPIVKNDNQKAKFSITKIDSETNKGLKDVVFSLMKDNQEVKKLTTLENGKIESGDLDFGTYTLREINVPKGYTQLPGDITIVIDGDETGNEYSTNIKVSGENQTLKGTNIEISNHSQKGKLILEKTAKVLTGISKDEQTGITKLEFTDTFLEDTTWNLIASEEIKSMDNQTVFYKKGDVVKTINTVKEKAVETNDIPLGKYILKEISTPKQFVLDKKEYEIEFTPQAKELKIHSITEKKYNERKDISFDLVKEFENSNLFTYKPKAEFGLFLKEEYRENGVIIPADTMLDKKIFEVTKDFETKEQTKKPKIVEIDEEITRYEISVFEEKQVDDKDKPIFSKDKENAEVIGYEQKTEKTLLDLIKVNTLEEKEAKTKELEEAGKVFDVKEIKETVKENVLSDTEKTSTNVTKFSVKGTFENILIDGKFYVKEISTDENYVIDNEKHEKEIDFTNVEEKHTTLPETKVINKLQKIKIEVVKTEEGDKKIPVQGARYKLVAVDPEKGETVVGIYTTDSKGKLSVTELPKGKYYLEEVSAPVGYFKSEGKVEIDTTNKSHGEKIVVEVENQKIPEIKTNATDKETGKKNINPTKTVTIKDKVTYKDLVVGKTYTFKGVLMDKETEKPLTGKSGKTYTAELTFKATQRNGFVELDFIVDSEAIRGKETVVFEDLYKDGKLLVSHNDINDKDQTVKITNPEIKTKFSSTKEDKKTLDPISVISLTDHVQYNNLVIGEEYQLDLVVMNKETNRPLLDEKGQKIKSTKKFVATSKEGIIPVVVDIDLNRLRGAEIVAFEELTFNGEIMAIHKEINDKDQTVKITNPEIKTKFTDIKGDKTISGNYKIKLVDNVEYKDLIIGNEYEVKMRVAIKGTNPIEFIKDENGNDLIVIKKFIADKKDGIIQIEVDLDLSTLKGKEIVAFEKIYQNGKLIATHEDINDKDQTIEIQAPEMPLTGSLKQHTNLIIGGLLLACGLIVLNRKNKLIKKNNLEEE
ncbi:VaFE repeat-containing surface-anchored protein [Helcococcus ovis]|uniref:VaFE repeat-containing surface-anchored protein n=1 Tax=Helcococcus ovis TaxID=72026 RepID=UPI0038BCF0D4